METYGSCRGADGEGDVGRWDGGGDVLAGEVGEMQGMLMSEEAVRMWQGLRWLESHCRLFLFILSGSI